MSDAAKSRMVAQIQESSPLLERIARTIKSPEAVKQEKAEAAILEATNFIQWLTQAALLRLAFILTTDNGGDSGESDSAGQRKGREDRRTIP